MERREMEEEDKKARPEREKERVGAWGTGACSLYLNPELLSARVTDSDLVLLSRLPPLVERREWLASHATMFFNLINLQFSCVSEFCNAESCPCMSIGNTQLCWQDGERSKKVRVTAPQYIDLALSATQRLLTDDSIFPTKYGQDFLPCFEAVARRVFRLLFHVAAHVATAHFSTSASLGLHPHLNTLISHLLVFAHEFNLIPADEVAAIASLASALLAARASEADSNKLPSSPSTSQRGDDVSPVDENHFVAP
uniref:MOB kinase activator 2-like isoform X1 n=1 Tax=Myxine glutinosa TaxID=7769 RepID=UPI00358F5C31